MYQVLIVDDEQPTLRFINSIIKQFAKGFHVVAEAPSGELALDILATQKIDLLITDITMHGMNGIELAMFARQMQPAIHILIVSGYGEFEYAQGAIKAGVDDYLLKPINIQKMSVLLETIRRKLDGENAELSANLITSIASGQSYSREAAVKVYGRKKFRFAYVCLGNLDMVLPKTLGATACLEQDEYFQILRGRNDREQILIAEDTGIDEFISQLSVYLTRQGTLSTWTAIYTPEFEPIEELSYFIHVALEQLYNRTVLGTHQILKQSGNLQTERVKLPASDLKQVSYFFSVGNTKLVKEYFLSLASLWEKGRMPVRQVWHMVRQLIHQAASSNQLINNNLEDILQELNELIQTSGSYSELMTSIYTLLIDDGGVRNQKMTPEELYDYAAGYIRDNFAQPLSMQSVCDEIGISQTYLSRLFRKYSDTTFNAFLTKCRMDSAMKMLQEKPDLLLRDVAACVGYEDSSYFTKVFRQYTGKTPSQWIDMVS